MRKLKAKLNVETNGELGINVSINVDNMNYPYLNMYELLMLISMNKLMESDIATEYVKLIDNKNTNHQDMFISVELIFNALMKDIRIFSIYEEDPNMITIDGRYTEMNYNYNVNMICNDTKARDKYIMLYRLGN